ncbi:MAG: hypothetical protein GEU91_18620 [Rhizobiales bacterium]|nr:hypothetical protein [Hyphomicrobiales bacterium]
MKQSRATSLPRLANWLLLRLSLLAHRRPPDQVIGREGDDYLRRWYLIPRNRWCNVYLHHFLRSDDDRALHDHPWWNLSFLLAGSYVEHTISAGGINVRALRRAGDFKFRTARSAHRVELVDGPCWTLFLTGPRLRDWGFHCPNGWVPWQRFTDSTNSGRVGPGCDA